MTGSAALEHLFRTMTVALPLAGSRQLADGPTAAELALEAAFAHALEPVLLDQYRDPLRDGGLEQLDSDNEDELLGILFVLLATAPATGRLETTLNRYGRRAFDIGGALGLAELGLPGAFQLVDEDIIGAMEMFIATELVATAGNLSITATTGRELARQIAAGRAEGLTDADIAEQLGPYARGRALVRSGTTANTEGVRFSRSGMATVYDRNGVDQVIHRTAPELSATGPCPICEPRDGRAYSITNGVVVGDDLPLHPWCILPGNEAVPPGRIKAATKTFYDGPCIEIALSNGRRLTITPNHPVLTPAGWFAAGSLRKGMDVVGATNSKRLADIANPDDDYVPTTIEKLWHSLHVSPSMSTVSVPLTAEDFHGDGRGMDRHVDIVLPNRLLQGGREATLGEQFRQPTFVGRDVITAPFIRQGALHDFAGRHCAAASGLVGSGNLGRSFLYRHILKDERSRLGMASHFQPLLTQAIVDQGAADIEGFGDARRRFPGRVAPDDFPHRQLDGRPLTPMGAVAVDAGLFEAPCYGLRADTMLAREFCNSFSSLIATYEIVEIREFDFSGHVYDLQVAPYHLYLTEGIITHNCVCYHEPALDGQPLSETDWTAPEGVWVGG